MTIPAIEIERSPFAFQHGSVGNRYHPYAASEATSATTPRRSRGRPSGRGITRSLLRGRGRVLPQPLGRPGRRRGEGGAAGARALA
eukprot:scaffold1607_cov71-Phaeocystis_antarctica.AAC.2